MSWQAEPLAHTPDDVLQTSWGSDHSFPTLVAKDKSHNDSGPRSRSARAPLPAQFYNKKHSNNAQKPVSLCTVSRSDK
ncbi:unnamed protein product [Plutella xylostella]|uniref:(diamondback moth) hypothetical protein n=1 Tax=Plutella xylostella TaxID=51655 RepID=A0A8S4DE61_PLUXY|nr:unnamed protein product [Plutella xylostella]